MSESLRQILARTGFRASLAEEYAEGEAPGTLRNGGHVAKSGYFDLPPVKKPDWKWYIPAYFFVGGVSSGAYVVATLADIIGRKDDQPIVKAGRLVALVGLILSPIFLIVDLGRPERFHHMLRVFKPRSMMNQGTWVVTTAGLFSGLAVTTHVVEAYAPPIFTRIVVTPLRILSWLGLVPAVYLGSYTGVLLSATSVALWARNKLLMGPLFFSSALATGIAATHLVARLLWGISDDTERRIRRVESISAAAELALTAASGVVLRRTATPLLIGRLALTYQIGSVGLGLIAPLLLHARSRPGTPLGIVAAVLTLFGGVIMRFAVVEAGKQSADDQESYFDYTRKSRDRKGPWK